MSNMKVWGAALLATVSSVAMGQNADLKRQAVLTTEQKAAKFDSTNIASKNRKEGKTAELDIGSYGASARFFQPSNIGNTEVTFFAGLGLRPSTGPVSEGPKAEIGIQSKNVKLFKDTVLGTLGAYGSMDMINKQSTLTAQARMSRKIFGSQDTIRGKFFVESNLITSKAGQTDGTGKLVFSPRLAAGLSFEF